MKTYQVYIARNETTVYGIKIDADSEAMAEKLAYLAFGKGNYDSEKIVFGEEFTEQVTEIEG